MRTAERISIERIGNLLADVEGLSEEIAARANHYFMHEDRSMAATSMTGYGLKVIWC